MNGCILVMDDDVHITSMLQRSLTFEGYDVVIAHSGIEGLQKLKAYEPELIILDVMMPHGDGWHVCREVRQRGVDVPILMLTAKDEVSDRVRGLDAGADDYMVKPFAWEELLARIRALLRRRRVEGRITETVSFSDVTMDVSTREVYRGNRRIELTGKEFELLRLFLAYPRIVLSRDKLMDSVWGIDFSGSSNVLEVYIALLRQKLEEGGARRIIHTVRGTGYVLREEHA